jgi:hypothetical protein
MKPNSTKVLPCAIFGHNYTRSKTNLDHTVELVCTHCDAIVVTDRDGNFENNTLTNGEIKDTLQRLYRLNRLLTKARAS